jgi:CRISPR/Cas system-associated exonuclease Cas4 (RecB family)
VVVVFPNRRARLFFNQYLVENAENTLFAPQYADLDTLFSLSSNLKIADDLMLVSILYNVYTEHFTKKNESIEIETFDEFFHFGEIILNDFNDIDKYLANAKLLYGNIADWETLSDDFEHLTEVQKEILGRFFKDIKINKTKLKERFFEIWNILADVYVDFKNRLKIKGLAYQGMLQRDALENIDKDLTAYKQECYVFIGFNVLTACEEKLLKNIKPKALFYWDYDSYYFDNQRFEAGKFLRKNIEKFPQAAKFDVNNFEKQKKITLVSTTSETSQVGFIPLWIKQLAKQSFDKPDSAIVFCNENMLLPALSFIPAEVQKLNVTMGYPLAQTPIYDFVIRLLDLQQKGIKDGKFYYLYLLSVLQHFYTSLIFSNFAEIERKITKEKLFYSTEHDLDCELLFQKSKNPVQLSDYLLNIIKNIGIASKEVSEDFSSKNLFSEAIFRLYQIVNRLKDLVENGYLDLKLNTFISLIKRILAQETVPFHGEPAQGLQLMGMLETRNMDFKNLLVFSLNEGIMPKIEPTASFIPLFIRKHFKMSSIEEQDAVFAHIFYRLLQRAENITLVYNTTQNATSKSEMSRFLLQLLTEYNVSTSLNNRNPMQKISLLNNNQIIDSQIIEIKKTPELLAKIHSVFNAKRGGIKMLTPSAINSFIDCPLQFYLRYVAKFAEKEEISDELGNNILGNVVHKAIELIYRHIGKSEQPFTVSAEQIDEVLKNRILLENILEQAFEIEFFNHKTKKENYTGEQKIYFDVAKKFVKNQLKFDKKNAPFAIIGMEKKEHIFCDLDENVQVKIGGVIDSIRLKNNNLTVIDYKTSATEQTAKTLEELFDGNKDKRAKYILQALIYSLILEEKFADCNITPLLLYLPKMNNLDEFSEFIELNKKKIENFKPYSENLNDLLKSKLSEIFNAEIPFEANFKDKQHCKYCEFLNICK